MRPILSPLVAVLAVGCGTSTLDLSRSGSGSVTSAFTSPGNGGLDSGDAGVLPDGGPALECIPGQLIECTTTCGSAGIRFCSEGRWSQGCVPPRETCGNGADDDCNGFTDSLDPACFSCTPGQTRPCTGTCGSPGRERCSAEGQWETTCQLPAETCGNGLDDDCNGFVDGADQVCWECTPGQTRACTSTCGSTGTEGCVGGHWETTCHPPGESCGNGLDDDCNGLVDGADQVCWECTPGQSRSCTTSCGSTGHQGCTAGHWESSCHPPGESCDNGADDDCDGRVDHHDPDCTPIIHTCEAAEGNGCNGDLGYGDHCAPEENTGGCSAGRFWAWCNRRNNAYPDIWYAWVQGWVDSRCDGTLLDSGGQYDTWYCLSSTNDRYECTTPLTLSFDGAPVRLLGSEGSFAFTPGAPVQSAWPSAATPWLVRDLDGDGQILDGSELFGSNTRLPDGSLARNGFEALAALDGNRDGVIDARDPAFSSLRLWSDRDGDRRVDPGELTSLAAAGVAALPVRFTVEPRCDARGNCERERAGFTWTGLDGRPHTGALVDLYLATRPAPALVCSRAR